MAINPTNSAAALIGGGLVALGATQNMVQKTHPLAPGAVAAAIGLGALALSKNGLLSSAGYGALGVGGILLYEGITAMIAESKAKSDDKQSTQGMVGLDAIFGSHPKPVLASQTNIGLNQSPVAPKVGRNIMPSTAQGMSGNRYIPAFGSLYGGR